MEEKNNINTVVENTFKGLGEMVDVNTVIGQPFDMDNGDKVFPICKVTVGTLCGGGEYGKIGFLDKQKNLPFSAGNGSIVSLKPCGFLIKSNDKYQILSVCEEPYERLFNKASEFLEKMQGDN